MQTKLASRVIRATFSIALMIGIYVWGANTTEEIWLLHFADHPILYILSLPYIAMYWLLIPAQSSGMSVVLFLVILSFISIFYLYYFLLAGIVHAAKKLFDQ